MVYLAFATHVLLDCLTVYGTQILWPLSTPPVMWSTIFIIDPAYSIPLFIGVLAALILNRKKGWGHTISTACLILSTVYLVWSAGAKIYVNNLAHESLKRQNIGYDRLLTVATPFNTLLWRVLAMDADGYHEGYYSLLDETRDVQFSNYKSDKTLLKGLDDHWPVRRLQWFTHGFYAVEQFGQNIVMTDLRMGAEPSYVFRFKVGRMGNPHSIPSNSARVIDERNWKQLKLVWNRIFHETF